MAVLSIVFDYTNQYGGERKEQIIADIEANENGDYELETIMNKIKSYHYAKSRVANLEVTYYKQLISTGLIELV